MFININRWSFGGKLHFFVSLGIAEVLKIVNVLFIFRLPFSGCFWNSLNYTFTPNIREVMKVSNLDDHSFETDFKVLQNVSHIHCIFCE